MKWHQISFTIIAVAILLLVMDFVLRTPVTALPQTAPRSSSVLEVVVTVVAALGGRVQ